MLLGQIVEARCTQVVDTKCTYICKVDKRVLAKYFG
jgi:amidase